MKKLIILCIIPILLSGCMTQKKERRIAHSYFSQNPIELADICSQNFKTEEIKYIEGPTIIKTDTVKGETVYVDVECPDGTTAQGECPPNKTITIDKSRIDTVEVLPSEAKALIARLENENHELKTALAIANDRNDSLKGTNDNLEKRSRQRVFVLFGVGILAAIFLVLKFKKILF